MTISEPIEESGFFWLPEHPENRIPGFLRVSELGDATLETTSLGHPIVSGRSFGSPGLGSDPTEFERIIGITKIGRVTLDKCFERSYNTHFGSGLSTSVLGADRLFVGFDYQKEDEVTFSKLSFSVNGLDEWLRRSGIEVIHHENRNSTIHFSPPNPITLNISDEIELEFNFRANMPAGFNEASVSQRAYISLMSRTEKPLDDLLSIANMIKDFFSFVCTEVTCIDSIIGYSNEIKERGKETEWRVPVKIHYRDIPRTNAVSKDKSRDMLFFFADVEEMAERVFVKWVEAYSSHESVFKRYFLLSLDYTMDLERRFSFLVEGMAAIHKRKYGGEPHLADRLKKMMEPFSRFFGTENEVNDFIEKSVKTRNYLIHLHERDGDSVSDTDELFELNSKLEAWFQLYFLHTIGIEDSHLDRIAKENRHLRRYLEQTAKNV